MTKSRRTLQLGIALFLLLCAVSLDYLVLSVRADSAVAANSNCSANSSKSDSLMSPEGLSQRVQNAVEKVRPSLVTIKDVSQGPLYPVLPPLLPEFSNGDFSTFNDITQFPSILRADDDRLVSATGVIVSQDGFVWTSSDVVQGLDSVSVTLQDNTSYDGKVILSDPESGLGIVKIDAQKLPAAQLGETTKLKPADWAIAVALDDRREPILAAGMIASFSRSKPKSGVGTVRCSFPVATDFAGCAVVNLNGEVIGIHVAMPSMRGDSLSSCNALDTNFANELQHKAMQMTAISHQERIKLSADSDAAAAASSESTQKRKEGLVSQIDKISHLFSVPRSEWTSDSIASSVRSWLDLWQDAQQSPMHPGSNASESR